MITPIEIIAKLVVENRIRAADKDLPDSIRENYRDMVCYGENAVIEQAEKIIMARAYGCGRVVP